MVRPWHRAPIPIYLPPKYTIIVAHKLSFNTFVETLMQCSDNYLLTSELLLKYTYHCYPISYSSTFSDASFYSLGGRFNIIMYTWTRKVNTELGSLIPDTATIPTNDYHHLPQSHKNLYGKFSIRRWYFVHALLLLILWAHMDTTGCRGLTN